MVGKFIIDKWVVGLGLLCGGQVKVKVTKNPINIQIPNFDLIVNFGSGSGFKIQDLTSLLI